jgi:hypothetical protein
MCHKIGFYSPKVCRQLKNANFFHAFRFVIEEIFNSKMDFAIFLLLYVASTCIVSNTTGSMSKCCNTILFDDSLNSIAKTSF